MSPASLAVILAQVRVLLELAGGVLKSQTFSSNFEFIVLESMPPKNRYRYVQVRFNGCKSSFYFHFDFGLGPRKDRINWRRDCHPCCGSRISRCLIWDFIRMCDCPSILMSLVFWQDTLLQRLQDLPDVSSMKFACELLDANGYWLQHVSIVSTVTFLFLLN